MESGLVFSAVVAPMSAAMLAAEEEAVDVVGPDRETLKLLEGLMALGEFELKEEVGKMNAEKKFFELKGLF